ncbi:MAG TPA: ATP-binding protein [Oscillatoriaceae cyanobacterium]
MGLRRRILLMFLLVAALCTVTVVTGIIVPLWGRYRAIDGDLARTSLQSAQLASRYLEERIGGAQARVKFMSELDTLTYRDYDKASALFRRLSKSESGHPHLVAFDDQGRPVASSEPLERAHFSAWPIVRAALAHDAFVWSDRLIWPTDGRPTIALARRYRYYDRQGMHWGVVLQASDLSAWDTALNQSGNQVEVFDRQGQGLIPLTQAPSMRLARPEVAAALTGGSGTREVLGKEVLAYAGVPGVGWAVVAHAPTMGALLPIRASIKLAMTFGLVSFGIAVVLAYFLSGFLVAPIRRLEAGAAALARGEWNIGAESALLPTERDDELGALARSFSVMVRQLRERFETIESLVAQRTQELEKTNNQLRVAVDELKELDELKRALLDAVSHELRTPLNFIMGYASTLEDGLFGDLNGDQAHATRRILEGSERLLAMINDLLEISRLESGELALAPQAFDLPEFLALAVDEVQRAYGDRRHTFAVAVPEALPPVHADPERVGQILRQLLSNAAKFTEPGGRIAIRADAEGKRVMIAVEDTGIGIGEELLPRIWDSFRQGDGSLTRAHGGTGVGLAIVKRLLDAMGETVGVESKPGSGSTFFFTLAIARFDEPATMERTIAVPEEAK